MFQYDIHIIVSQENVTYDNHLHFVQAGGWICAVSVKTGHCTLCLRDLNEWQVASMHSAPVALLKPTQLYDTPILVSSYTRIKLTFILGGKGLVQDDSHMKWWFNHRFTIRRFCMHHFCRYDVHITVFCRIAIRVSYETLFRTIMRMPW